MQQEKLEELMAAWNAPSTLTTEGAATLIEAMQRGEPMTPDDGLQLVKFLRDNESTAEAGLAIETAAERLLDAALRDAEPRPALPASDAPWQKSALDSTLGVGLTAAYLASGTVAPEMLPHNLQLRDLDVWLGLSAGVYAHGWGFTVWARALLDAVTLLTLDMHHTRDAGILQLTAAIEAHLHCTLSWFGLVCYPELHFLNIPLAFNNSFVFAIPTGAGQVATRATDHDLFQIAYDALGTLRNQKPHEWTSLNPLEGRPGYGNVPGGLPGAGDLAASAPLPNYLGLQAIPETPDKPAIPPTPPLPPQAQGELDSARDMYAKTRIRERGSYGTNPADSTGVLVAYDATSLPSWTLNFVTLRVKVPGTASGPVDPVGEPPISMYYDAGCHFAGCGTLTEMRYSNVHDLP